MNTRLLFCAAACVMAVVSFTGCASIISGRHAEVAINTTPPGANVVIRDKRGNEVANVTTPAKVALKRSDKIIFPAQYTATIEAPGYQTAHVPMRSTINPWILGNLVIGGIPGLIIDDATGAAWKPRNDEIYQQLAPAYAAQPPAPIVGAPPMMISPPEFTVQSAPQSMPQSLAPGSAPGAYGEIETARTDAKQHAY